MRLPGSISMYGSISLTFSHFPFFCCIQKSKRVNVLQLKSVTMFFRYNFATKSVWRNQQTRWISTVNLKNCCTRCENCERRKSSPRIRCYFECFDRYVIALNMLWSNRQIACEKVNWCVISIGCNLIYHINSDLLTRWAFVYHMIMHSH